MNVGKWIFVAYVLFAIFIGTLVTVCVKQDVNLVTKDYYNQELLYQQQIERINNTNKLAQKPVVKVKERSIQINFGSGSNIEKGKLKLFCPSNPLLDKEFTLNANDVNSFTIDRTSSKLYRVQIWWTAAGEEYYQEEAIYI